MVPVAITTPPVGAVNQFTIPVEGIAVSEEPDGEGTMVTLYATPDGGAPSTTLIRKQLERAAALRDYGYVALAFSELRHAK